MAVEKYLKVLYELGSSVESESATPAMPVTPMTPTTPAREEDDDDDDEMRQVLLQRVLQHIVIKVLPRVQDASERMQVIWVLAQFVKASELQKVLLGLVLRRLMIQEQVEVKLEERFAQYQHVSASSPCEA